MPDRKQALREMSRVTKPGGTDCDSGLAESQRGVMGSLARFIRVHTVVPWLGSLFGVRALHLQRSIAAFP